MDAEFAPLSDVVDEFVQEPTTMPWGNRSILFRDPDGQPRQPVHTRRPECDHALRRRAGLNGRGRRHEGSTPEVTNERVSTTVLPARTDPMSATSTSTATVATAPGRRCLLNGRFVVSALQDLFRSARLTLDGRELSLIRHTAVHTGCSYGDRVPLSVWHNKRKGHSVPMINVKLIEGVFTGNQTRSSSRS